MNLQRQVIHDNKGSPIGIILSWEEYELIKDFLEDTTFESTLTSIEQSAKDPLFMQDLQDTMQAFTNVDSEWWERE